MKRVTLLDCLRKAEIATSDAEVFEQSDCFAFTGGRLVTFNGEAKVEMRSPFDFDAVVVAKDLSDALAVFPDDEITVQLEENELRLSGKRKSAGLAVQDELRLPLDAVPKPEKWKPIPEGLIDDLLRASRACSNDVSTNFLGTLVHLSSSCVEGFDNLRYLRIKRQTDICKSDCLIPAASIRKLEKVGTLDRVCIDEGWIHFKKDDLVVSICLAGDSYFDEGDLAEVMAQSKTAVSLELPKSLPEILERANTVGSELVEVVVSEGKIAVTSRKDSGWYRETKAVPYSGRRLKFCANFRLLIDALGQNRSVLVDEKKMKLKSGNASLVVALEPSTSKDED